MDSKKTPKEPDKNVKPEVIEAKPVPSRVFPRLTLVFIILILLIASYFILSSRNQQQTINVNPSPTTSINNSTADWKSYTNTDYGFSIKYPSGWKFQNITNELVVTGYVETGDSIHTPLNYFGSFKGDDAIFTFLSPKDLEPVVPKKGPGDFWVSGTRLEIKKGDLANEVVKLESKINQFDNPRYTKENQSINSTLWTIISNFNGVADTYLKTALTEKNGYVYIMSNDRPSYSADIESFNQILSTFQFLDNDQSEEGQFCGGIMGVICPDGYKCKYDGDYPDAGGICIKE